MSAPPELFRTPDDAPPPERLPLATVAAQLMPEVVEPLYAVAGFVARACLNAPGFSVEEGHETLVAALVEAGWTDTDFAQLGEAADQLRGIASALAYLVSLYQLQRATGAI